MRDDKNEILLVGIIEKEPEYWYTNGKDVKEYLFTIGVKRYSGRIDHIRVCVPEDKMKEKEIKVGDAFEISGQVRTRNIKLESGPKKSILEVFVFQRYINRIENFTEDMYKNECTIFGTIVKKNQFKDKLTSKKVLLEFILASNRRNGEGAYIPCVAWEKDAYVLKDSTPYIKILLKGRMESKELPNKKEVYWISVKEYT